MNREDVGSYSGRIIIYKIEFIMKKMFPSLLVTAIISACGQNMQPPNLNMQNIDKVCDQFMQQFSHQQFHDAYSILRKNSVIASEIIDTLESQTIEQLTALLPTYGKILSAELVEKKWIGTFIEKRYYILRFQNY